MYKERIRNFSTLFFSNVFGQVVALALYPIIARFYLPEDFSRFGFIVSLTIFLSIFATGQLHTALLNPKTEEEANDLVGLSTTLVIAASLLTLVYSLFFDLSLWIMPLYLLLYSLNEIAKMVYIRRKAFATSAASQVSFRVFGNGIKLVPTLVGLKAFGLVLSEVISLFLVTIYALKEKVFNIQFNKEVLRKYWKFPAVQSFTVALGLLISDFPILFWSQKFSGEQVGHFVMAQKLLITPALVFSTAVQNSSVHQFLKSKNQFKFYLVLMAGTSALGLGGFLFIQEFGHSLFGSIFTGKWTEGLDVYKYVALLFLTKLGFMVTQATIVLKHEVKTSFVLRIVQLLILIILLKTESDFFVALQTYVYLDLFVDILLILRASILVKRTELLNEK